MRKVEERAAGADVEEAGGIGEGQRAEDYGVDDREDGGVGADAEGQSEDGDKREAGIFAEGAGGKAEVLGEIVEPGPRPLVAGDGLDQRDVAEFAACGVSGLLRGGAAIDVVLRGHFEMGVEVPRSVGFGVVCDATEISSIGLLAKAERSKPRPYKRFQGDHS